MTDIVGIHHMAAVTTNVERTTEFYSMALGLKRAFLSDFGGDEERISFSFSGPGRPEHPLLTFVHVESTELTPPKQVGGVVLSGRIGSLSAWRKRLLHYGTAITGRAWAFGEELLCFTDPDGLELALTETRSNDLLLWPANDDPGDIESLRAIEIEIASSDISSERLLQLLGFARVATQGAVTRFQTGAEPNEIVVDLVRRPRTSAGRGCNRVRRLALRLASGAAIATLQTRLAAHGFHTVQLGYAPRSLQILSEPAWDLDIVLFEGLADI